jgi:hypothetical protein
VAVLDVKTRLHIKTINMDDFVGDTPQSSEKEKGWDGKILIGIWTQPKKNGLFQSKTESFGR